MKKSNKISASKKRLSSKKNTGGKKRIRVPDLEADSKMLNALNNAQSRYISGENPAILFDYLLEELLKLTDSEYGFISEVLHTNDNKPYLNTHAITNIAWNEETRKFYDENIATGLEFRNLNTIFGAVLTTGKPVISNDPANDPRRGGLPQGHPPLNSFFGAPFYTADKFTGMIGIANKPDGYTEELFGFLEPFLSTCATVLEAIRINRSRIEAEKQIRRNIETEAVLSELSNLLLVSRSTDDISNLILDKAKKLTGSKYGFAGYIDPETGYLICPTMTRDIWDECQIKDKDIAFKTWYELFGWVLENGKSILTNNPSEDSRSSGIPVGHVKIERFFSAPSIIDDKVIGQIGLANSDREYDDEDLKLVKRMANLYALVMNRHWAEERLQASEEKYKRIFENSPEAVALMDAKGTILEINTRIEEKLGFKPDEIIGKNVLEAPYLPEESRKIVKKKLESKLIEGKLPVYELELISKSGKKIMGLVNASRFYDESGEIAQTLVLVSDITLLKETEAALESAKNEMEMKVVERTEELERSQERFSGILKIAGDSITSYCSTIWLKIYLDTKQMKFSENQ